MTRSLPGMIFLAVLTFGPGCGAPITFNSVWRDQPIAINGLDDDWEGKMSMIEKQRIGLGIRNDREYLYIAVAPLDRGMAMRMVRNGMTIWFDSTGGKQKSVGIHFPMGLEANGLPTMAFMSTPGGRDVKGNDPIEEIARQTLNEAEILGPGEWDRRRVTLYEMQGLAIKLTHSSVGMFYELRVPLSAVVNSTTAIGAHPGQTIGIGLETGEMKLGIRGGPPAGFEGTMPRGGGMGAGGGPPLGGPMEPPKPLRVWLKTELSKVN